MESRRRPRIEPAAAAPPPGTCDLHVHSKYSDHPSEWFLRRIGAPESFMEPREVYRRCKAKGMQYVTLADHNAIAGALEIAEFPDTFLSAEVTTYFPEDGCKIHCLVAGISEPQFAEINQLRENIYELRAYLAARGIFHSIAHPFFRVNGRLTVEHVEKLLLLFDTFEGINGSRHPRAGELVYVILRNLDAATLAELADKHGIAPLTPGSWQKRFTGGSDDHSGCYLADAHTITPPAPAVAEFLRHLREGRHEMAGCCGSSLKLAHSLYHIAWQYYRRRMAGDRAGFSPLGTLLRRLAEGGAPRTWRDNLRHVGRRLFRRHGPRNALEAILIQEFSEMMKKPASGDPDASIGDQRAFQFACQIGQQLGYVFLNKVTAHLRRGELLESIQAVSALGPVALGIAPYFAAFKTQHQDEPFLQALATRFPAAAPLLKPSEKKAWVTDTFSDVNGVARTIQALGAVARAKGRKLTIVTSLEKPPKCDLPLVNFRPVGSFKLPEYAEQTLAFPPFLEMLRHFEKEKYAEIIISTPGPVGLAAFFAGRLLGLRVTGIYHTDFPLYLRHLTQDEIMEALTWRFMQWFFGQLDTVFVPSDYYRQLLAEHGLAAERLLVMPRGVDLQVFNPAHRDPGFWRRHGVGDGFLFLYVGRMSAEKNLEPLLAAFQELRRQTRQPVQLALVGDGPLLPELRKRGQAEGIHFTGVLHGEALSAAYASADAFVFPSTTDTFGNVVLEAQASGLPAIVADRGGPPEIVRAHQSGLVVDIARPGELAAAMRRLCEDRTLYADLAVRALANARDSSWEEILEQFWQAERRLAAPPERRDGPYWAIQPRGDAAAGRPLSVA
ncbi:MAG: glycosyltransferase [Lentisphaeria bacterium]|jgi:glycosyltransferase involved in cell wall biosynthesis